MMRMEKTEKKTAIETEMGEGGLLQLAHLERFYIQIIEPEQCNCVPNIEAQDERLDKVRRPLQGGNVCRVCARFDLHLSCLHQKWGEGLRKANTRAK